MNDKRNASGCKDKTAYEATKHLDMEERRMKKLLDCIKYVANTAGYDIVGRIVLKDQDNEREWR